MNYKEAMIGAIKEGVKIRVKGASHGYQYIRWESNTEQDGHYCCAGSFVDHNGNIATINTNLDNEWEIYEGPKKEERVEKCEKCETSRLLFCHEKGSINIGHGKFHIIDNSFCPECGHKIEVRNGR